MFFDLKACVNDILQKSLRAWFLDIHCSSEHNTHFQNEKLFLSSDVEACLHWLQRKDLMSATVQTTPASYICICEYGRFC